MHMLQICLLGNFRLTYASEVVASVNTPRLQVLLAYLLLHRQAPQPRQQLAFLFWPDSSEKQAHTNLRKLLFQLRNALPDADRFLTQDHLTVQWRPDAPYTLDVADLQATLARCATADGRPMTTAQQAELAKVATLYPGELLPSCFDEWLLPLRRQLHQEVMRAIEQLIVLAEHQREYQAGLRYAQHLLGLDPLHENGYRHLMQLHALNGDRAAALQHYHTCVTLLQRELGVEPEEETQALYTQLLRQEELAHTAPNPMIFDTPLFGRAAEWQTLLTLWQQVQRGEPHFVALAGEAGIGKTRLAEELFAWAHTQGIRVARTRSYEAEGGLAFAPVTEWLRSAALKPALKKLDKIYLSEVIRVLPELLHEEPQLTPPLPLRESWQRQRFFESLARALLVDKSPLLLLIEDLQWCDHETLTWLRFLLRHASRARLLLVGNWREDAVDESHPLQTLLRDLLKTNQFTLLALKPFTRPETTAFAEHIAKRSFNGDEIEQLYSTTEGHPLFIAETVRSLKNTSTHAFLADLHSDSPKVQNVIQARLTQLSRPARAIVNVAATIGRRFSGAILAPVTQQPERVITRVLEELWQKRIIREQSPGLYDFYHDRIREVVYQGLSAARRRQLHQQVAEALEQLYPNQIDEISGEVAAHYEQANQKLKARSYWQRSGKRAAAHFANHEAIHHFSKALTLTPSHEYSMRFELLTQREAIYTLQGQPTERFTDLLTLQQLSQQLLTQDPTQATPAIRAAILLGKYYQRTGRPEQTVVSLQTATALAQQYGERILEAQAWSHLGNALFHMGKLAGARDALIEAIACAEREKLTDVEAASYEFLAAVCMFSGAEATEIETYLQRSLARYQELIDSVGISRVLNKLGYLIVAQGEGNYAAAKAYYERGLEITRQSGNSGGETNILRNLGVLYNCIADYPQAQAVLALALQLDRQQKDLHSEGVALDYLAVVQMNLGAYELAQKNLDAALTLLQQTKSGGWLCKGWSDLSLLNWLQGNTTAAIECAEQAHKLAAELGDQRQVGYALTRLGRALQSQQRHAEALKAFTQAYTIHQALAQYNRALEPLAGMALSALAQQDYHKAKQAVETILTQLQSAQLDFTDEALLIYLACYQVLTTIADPRAAALCCRAQEQLQARAAALSTAEERKLFWSVPLHHNAKTLKTG
ncbi:MAG: AAA family ATPase [Caldilineaceae bacterium]|nr:AAA family ATPase [Caldilineaceae bacterium]